MKQKKRENKHLLSWELNIPKEKVLFTHAPSPPPLGTLFHKMLAQAYSLQIPSDSCQIKSPQKYRQNEQMAFSFLKTMCIIYTTFFSLEQ